MHRSKRDLHLPGMGMVTVGPAHTWDHRTRGWVGFLSPFPALQPLLPAGADLGLLFPGHRADIPAATQRPSRSPACPWSCCHRCSTHPTGPPGPQNCCHPNPELAAHRRHRSTR